ncbi:MAG: nitrite reductase small subunit NirD [Pseudomonadota bacterium]
MQAHVRNNVVAEVLCHVGDLVAGSGVAVLSDRLQIALFYLPDQSPALYAIGNFDPLGSANVLSRGIVGDKGGELVVASPLYKQHFSLKTGRCLEQDDVTVPVFNVRIEDQRVVLFR